MLSTYQPSIEFPQSLDIDKAVRLISSLSAERMRRDFIEFVKRAWPIVEPKELQWNWHMHAIAEHLVYVTQQEIRYLMVNIPPRMSKSSLVSVLWPVWHWLQNPETQFIGASYDRALVERDAGNSRRLIESGWFRERYGAEFYILPDENRKEMYKNNQGGYRISTSVGGRATGEGGDIQLLDDPHNAQKVESQKTRLTALSWHDNAWRSRVNDPNKAQKVYIGQRSHDNDIFGLVLSQEKERWVVLSLPMEFEPSSRCITYLNDGKSVDRSKKIFTDPRKKEGELLNPTRFNAETVRAEKKIMSDRGWNAQYQQRPEGQQGLILKRNWWKQWIYPAWHKEAGRQRELPAFFEVIQVYDTAFEEGEENDYTARTTWGFFEHSETTEDVKTGRLIESEPRVCAMLLDRYKDRPGFPELRKIAAETAIAHGPDKILIEKKVSGHSLIQELRRKRELQGKVFGVKVVGDLVFRAHMVSFVLEQGLIYYIPRTWSFDVIEEAAKFPLGDHDDQVSTIVMAWQYMRRYHDLMLPDEKSNDTYDMFKWKRTRLYA